MVKPRTRRARRLRRDATESERLLWRALRGMALPVKARRQHPIGRFIADFAVPSRRLVIEIDGGQHAAHARRDAARTHMLEAQGWRVIRFWNNDVTENLTGVLQTIAAEIEKAPTSPQPSPPTFSNPSIAGRSLRSLGSGRRGSNPRPPRRRPPPPFRAGE